MDAQRKKMTFMVVGAAVLVIVAAVAIWSPQFPPEGASGAIGAVQKHHQTQITNKDVVLADPQTVKNATILYGDFLNDAAKLQAIGADLAMKYNRVELGRFYDKADLAGAVSSLESHNAELGARFQSHAADTVNAMIALGQQDSSLGAAVAELGSIKNDLGANLSLEQMQDLSNRLGAVAATFQNQGLLSRFGAKAEADLNAALNLASHDALGAAHALEAISADLGSREHLGAQNILGSVNYLGAIAVEAKANQEAISTLGSVNLENKNELGSRLGAVIADLGHAAANLESRASDNLNSRLGAQQELASRLGVMDAKLGAYMEANKANLGSSQELNAAFVGLNSTLDNAVSGLQAQFAGSMSLELQAIGSHLASVSELQSKLGSAMAVESKMVESKANLGSKLGSAAVESNMVESKANLGSRLGSMQNLGIASGLFNQSSLGSFQNYLGSVQHLESNLVGNHQDLANQAADLSNKVNLGSKVNVQ